MAAKRKIAKVQVVSVPEPAHIPVEEPKRNFLTPKTLRWALVIFAVAALVTWKKNWFVVATINGRPITTLELQKRLNDDYKQPALEQLITEKAVLDEASKNNAIPSKEEVDTRYSEFAKDYGGVDSLNSYLAQQGQTQDYVKRYLTLMLAVEKMYASTATVSAKDIDDFVRVNRATLKASDSAGLKAEAEAAIRKQSLLRIVVEKMQELRDKAVVKMF